MAVIGTCAVCGDMLVMTVTDWHPDTGFEGVWEHLAGAVNHDARPAPSPDRQPTRA